MRWPFHIIVTVAVLAAAASAAGARSRPTQFLNLTGNTILEFYLAPAGTSNWGPNQCKNDRDGAIDAYEHLRASPMCRLGTYDAKFTDVTGRTCTVHNIKVQAGSIFWIEQRDLKSCRRSAVTSERGFVRTVRRTFNVDKNEYALQRMLFAPGEGPQAGLGIGLDFWLPGPPLSPN
jgi:hypothetical protein